MEEFLIRHLLDVGGQEDEVHATETQLRHAEEDVYQPLHDGGKFFRGFRPGFEAELYGFCEVRVLFGAGDVGQPLCAFQLENVDNYLRERD